MEQLEHSKLLAPSSADQWFHCSAAPKMQQDCKQEDTEDTLHGNASHWVASSILEAYKGDNTKSIISDSYIGQTAPNGIIITEEMVEAAEIYVSEVLRVMNKLGLLRALKVEQRVHMPDIHHENWGTPDSSAFDDQNGVLYIWDYKYGHRFVEVYQNLQMIDYANGLLHSIGINGIQDQHIKVVFCLVQPRCYQSPEIIRTWEVIASDLRPWFNKLHVQAAEVMGPNPTVQTGPHCRDCTARYKCKGAQHAALASIEYMGLLTDSVNELPPAALGIEIEILRRAADAIGYRCESLEQQAIALHKSGVNVPGWSVQNGKGRKKWTKSAAEVFALGELFGQDLRKPAEPITPTQAAKKGIDETVIDAYSIIPDTELKLVRDNGAKASRVFSQVKEDN